MTVNDVVLTLIEKLKNSALNTREQTSAAYMLGRLRSNSTPALPALINATRDSDYSLRQQAAYALGEIAQDPERCLPPLVAMIFDEHECVASIAICAIGKFGIAARKFTAYIFDAYKNRHDITDTMRFSVIFALANIGLHDEVTVSLLQDAIDRGSNLVREATIFALREIRKSVA